ncbi:hypothetical protein BXZ70DRAFT_107383 [Cristinia sonorae]|uniref:Uncharacterized protein n=1 Tax=Cristinia sonorae TaxID=1940300 RepID=A0A8K0URH8_9AGAR|nr:hypothetical protein BXZ70DRAFT_107383 [Cristinia sonorae]
MSMARPPDNSTSQGSPRRETPRVAPYLTHEVTHHGQVTLVPPQNAGRIRKTKKGESVGGGRRREREREEPRFNTAVPSSATRRARTTSARIPRQPQTPQTQVVELRITRDSEIPEYPPPSFQEAILTPPVLPETLSYATPSQPATPMSAVLPQSAHLGRSAGNVNSPLLTASSRLPMLSQPQTPSMSPLALSAASTPRPLQPPLPPSSTLAVSTTSTPPRSRLSPELLELRPIPQSSIEDEPEGSDGETGVRSDGAPSRPMTPESSANQWDSDRRLGVPLDDRVYRERLRLEAAESTLALVNTPRPAPVQIPEENGRPRLRGKSRCSRCEGLKPLDCARANEMRHPGDDSDEPLSSATSSRRPSPLRPDTASLPCSPMAVGTPLSATMNPWSSSLTLSSSSSVMSPTRPSGLLKRKESVILRKLFGAKSKEPEKPQEPEVKDELLGSWEVVDSGDLDSTPYARRPGLDREPSNSSTWTQVTVPTSPVFINRPVRPLLHAPSTFSLSASRPSPSQESPSGSQGSSSEPSPADKSKSRRKPPPPPPPRKLRQSPSVVWKTSAESANDVTSPTPESNGSIPAKVNFPSTTSLRSRPGPPLAPLTVPKNISCNEEAGPSAVPYTPSYATSEPSSSPPGSPSTPCHHYPGRPLPQVPYEPSPLARPVCPSLSPASPASSPLSYAEFPLSSSSPSPPSTPAHNVTRARPQPIEYSNLTELDVLASRLEDGGRDGRHYEDLLLLSEFAGPARPAISISSPSPSASTAPFLGRIETQRRRVLRDGRVKLKLALFGTVVDRCGICLSQFKDEELAALSRTCPLCRAPLDVSS